MRNLFSPGARIAAMARVNPESAVPKLAALLTDNVKLPALSAGVEDLYSSNAGEAEDAATRIEDNLDAFDSGATEIDDIVQQLNEETQNSLDEMSGLAAEGGTTTAAGVEDIFGAGAKSRSKLSPAMRTAIRQLIHAGATAADARAYHEKTDSPVGNGDAKIYDAGLEAFDNTDHRTIIARSIAYVPSSIAQDKVNDAIYRTEILTPDQGNYQIRVLIPTTHLEADRDENANEYNLGQKRLVDAQRYPEILKDNLIDIVPCYKVARATKFVDPAIVAPMPFERNGHEFLTAPLAMDVTIDLIAVNSLEEQANRGTSNSSDSLDRGVEVGQLYVRVISTGAASETVFVINVSGTNGSHFAPTVGYSKATELSVSFKNTYYISAESVTSNGAAPAVLGPILAANPNTVIGLQLTANGMLDVERANASLSTNEKQNKVIGIYERGTDTHRRTTLDDPTTAGLVTDAFDSIEIIGWLPNARAANRNKRDQGYIVRVEEDIRTYPVYMNSPFTARVPAGQGYEVELAELRKLAFVAARISNDLAGHAELHKTIDDLRQYKGMANETTDFKWANLGFAADPYIDPVIEEVDLDVYRHTQATNTGQKFVDITSLFALNITDVSLKLIQNSNLNGALAMLGAADYKVNIVASTDTYTAGYLNKIGDARTAGTEHKVIPVSTVDERWRDKIIINLQVTLDGNASILNFGRYLNMPRLVTDLMLQRSGGTAQEVSVQMRRKYIVTCPIVGVIHVKNLSRAVRELTRFQVAI